MNKAGLGLVLTVLLVLSVNSSTGVIYSGTGPSQINAINIDQTSGVPGDVITGSVDLTINDTLGYVSVALYYKNQTSGYFDYIDWIYANSTAQFEFVIQDYWPSGEFFFNTVYLSLANYDGEYFYNNTDFTSPSFTVSGTNFDSSPPTLVSFDVNGTTFYAGDTIKFQIILLDANPESYQGFSLSWLNGTVWQSSFYLSFTMNQTYADGSVQYLAYYTVSPYEFAGRHSIANIYLFDKAGNGRTYYNASDYIMALDIVGTTPDTDAPQILSLTTVGTMQRGRYNVMDMTFLETGSGLNYAWLRFDNAAGGRIDAYFYNTSSSEARASIWVDASKNLGTYTLTSIYVIDNIGNVDSTLDTEPVVSFELIEKQPISISVTGYNNVNETGNYVYGSIYLNNTLPPRTGSMEARIESASGSYMTTLSIGLEVVNDTELSYSFRVEDYISFGNGSVLTISSVSISDIAWAGMYFYDVENYTSPQITLFRTGSPLLDRAYFSNSVAKVGTSVDFIVETSATDFSSFNLITSFTDVNNNTWNETFYGNYQSPGIYKATINLGPYTYLDVVRIDVASLVIYDNYGSAYEYSQSDVSYPNRVDVYAGYLNGTIDPTNGSVIEHEMVDFNLEVYSNYSFYQIVDITIDITQPDGSKISFYDLGRSFSPLSTYYNIFTVQFTQNGEHDVNVFIKSEYGFTYEFTYIWFVNATFGTGSTGGNSSESSTSDGSDTNSSSVVTVTSDPDGNTTSSDGNVTGPPTLENPLPGFEFPVALFSIFGTLVVVRRRKLKI